PTVGAAKQRPGVLGPGFVAGLAGVRNGVELPLQLAGTCVEGANVAGTRGQAFRDDAAEDEQVSMDDAGCVDGDAERPQGTVEAFTKIDEAALAEGGVGLSCCRVERIETMLGG